MIASAEEFVRLRRSEVPSEYLQAAHDEAPIEVWKDVIARYPEMRVWVAHNKTVPLEILSILAWDSDPDVRHSVAMKNKLPADLMLALAGDENESVRMAIARNKKVTVEALRKIADLDRS